MACSVRWFLGVLWVLVVGKVAFGSQIDGSQIDEPVYTHDCDEGPLTGTLRFTGLKEVVLTGMRCIVQDFVFPGTIRLALPSENNEGPLPCFIEFLRVKAGKVQISEAVVNSIEISDSALTRGIFTDLTFEEPAPCFNVGDSTFGSFFRLNGFRVPENDPKLVVPVAIVNSKVNNVTIKNMGERIDVLLQDGAIEAIGEIRNVERLTMRDLSM